MGSAPVETPPAAIEVVTPDPVEPTEPTATCENVLTEAEYARLAAEGFAVQQPFVFGPALERMVAAGALVCQWSQQRASDAAAWYARLEVGDDGETWLAELSTEGWLEDTERGDGTYLAPYDWLYQPSVQLRDGVLHFASYNVFLEPVLELQ